MKDKKHKDGFQIPKNYFDEFEDRLFNKINEDIIPKESGFEVPEGYFNKPESKLFSTLKITRTETKVISIVSRKTWVYAASIAAIAILIFSIANTNQSITTINKIDITSIENYIEEGNLNLSSYDISSLLTEEELIGISKENDFISEESLEQYLIENINDTTILIE